MGDIAVKIKGNHLTCQIGKPKFERKVQGVVIQGATNIDTFLLALPEYANEADAFTALGPNKLYWISSGTDTEFPNSLKRTPA